MQPSTGTGSSDEISTGHLNVGNKYQVSCQIFMRTGISNLPLHVGRCPRWLFPRMVKLGGAIAEAVVDEYKTSGFLKRLSDPYWFQSLACCIGFDWHSSGTTTTACGALKKAVNSMSLGVMFCGGKGKAGNNTLSEIRRSDLSEKKADKLCYASRLSAKVDSALIQDSYQIYHHSFAYDEKGSWAVVQQGMNTCYARRYHWLSNDVEDFVCEPESAICTMKEEPNVLDLAALAGDENRKICTDIVNDGPSHLAKYLQPKQLTLDLFSKPLPELTFGRAHYISDMHNINMKTLQRAYELQPKDYEELLAVRGMGARSLRALGLVSELVYGAPLSWKDPARFSFAHGGKDNIPYPVDRGQMETSLEFISNAIKDAKIGEKDKLRALRALHKYSL